MFSVFQINPVLILSLFQERYPNNSMFNEVYGKNMNTSTKAEVTPSVAHQETSLYSLFEGTPWSPSLPASSGNPGTIFLVCILRGLELILSLLQVKCNWKLKKIFFTMSEGFCVPLYIILENAMGFCH